MDVQVREARPDDSEACGRILFEAFATLANSHGFPPDFPSVEAATGVSGALIGNPGFYGVVAESEGRIVGSNFLNERSTIAGVGPITIDPGVQDKQIGRRLMLAVLDRAGEKQAPGVRLLQAAYHNRSLALYAKLGFEVREACVTLQGDPIKARVPGYAVRSATPDDLEACNRVCLHVHGHDRSGELRDAIEQGSARVVEHDGRLTGYCTDIAFLAHAVGESNDDIRALIGAATQIGGPGLLLPARNSALLRWCLNGGLRIVQVMTLMTIGLYNEPAGAYLPSVLY
jgi:predicted N-acetyltransferase YhbS